MTCFGIIRHAPTEWNEDKRIQGQQDSPLSIRGKTMAEEWGVQLCEYNWDRLLCSDLQRVQETTKRINMELDLPIETDTNLREQNWGYWTGMTLGEIKTQKKDQLKKQEQKGWNFRPPGGETRIEVLERSIRALSEAHAAWSGETILVVTHEGVIKCLLYHLLGRRFLPHEPRVIEGYQLHLLGMGGNNLFLKKMNCLALSTISIEKT